MYVDANVDVYVYVYVYVITLSSGEISPSPSPVYASVLLIEAPRLDIPEKYIMALGANVDCGHGVVQAELDCRAGAGRDGAVGCPEK